MFVGAPGSFAKSKLSLMKINTHVTRLLSDFPSASIDNQETLSAEELLALFGHHSAVNLEAVVQVFLCVKFEIGAERSVSRGRSVEDASNPGVNQRHGTHDTRFPGDIKIVACADVGLRGCRLGF